jgi:iron-sulfur cluster assembly accessory protein
LTGATAAVSFEVADNMNTIATTDNPLIGVTENAAREIESMLARNPKNAGRHLRVYVEEGGCSGMQYGMVFDEKRAEDRVTEARGVTILVDPFSARFVRGSVVDFSDALTGGGFKISNPNARQSCGCGKSFEA